MDARARYCCAASRAKRNPRRPGACALRAEAISQLEHALQAAALAEAQGEPPAMILAALLHDIGHMIHAYGENPAAQGRDDRHELIGAKWLSKRLPASVTEPIRLHVAAKRYLCATDPGYAGQLAPDSVLSLALQGGAMSPGEAPAFRAEPFAEDAIATGADKQCHRPDAVVVNKSLLRIREVKS